MAEHYGTAIIPARPVKPRDKPTAEGTVKVIETWILAALRNRRFFTFEELNKAIIEKLVELNEKLFKKEKEAGILHLLKKKENSSCHYLLPRMKRPSGQLPPYSLIITYNVKLYIICEMES